MSRRSQAFAEGVQKFSWDINQIDNRFRARCQNYPSIEGWGSSEQTALNDARQKIEAASEKAELGTNSKVV